MTKQELKAQIEKLQSEYDAMPDDVVFNQRAVSGQCYGYLSSENVHHCVEDLLDEVDLKHWELGNYYLTRSSAERAAAYYKKWGQFNRVAFELMEGEPIVELTDTYEVKRYVYFDVQGSQWLVSSANGDYSAGEHYFRNQSTAQSLADWANQNMPEG